MANKTIVLSGAGSEDVGIHTLVAGSSSWQSQTVALNMPVGQIQLVQANGVPVGIMVTEESGKLFPWSLAFNARQRSLLASERGSHRGDTRQKQEEIFGWSEALKTRRFTRAKTTV